METESLLKMPNHWKHIYNCSSVVSLGTESLLVERVPLSLSNSLNFYIPFQWRRMFERLQIGSHTVDVYCRVHCFGRVDNETLNEITATNGWLHRAHHPSRRRRRRTKMSILCHALGGSNENKNDENEKWPVSIERNCTADWKTLEMYSQRLPTSYSWNKRTDSRSKISFRCHNLGVFFRFPFRWQLTNRPNEMRENEMKKCVLTAWMSQRNNKIFISIATAIFTEVQVDMFCALTRIRTQNEWYKLLTADWPGCDSMHICTWVGPSVIKIQENTNTTRIVYDFIFSVHGVSTDAN